MIKVAVIIGTRPEAVKMAPIIWQLKKQAWAETQVIISAQHRELLDEMLSTFAIQPDVDLSVMQANQSLSALTARLCEKFDRLFSERKYDVVLTQGDTTTTFVCGLICFYHRIKFGHIEAGLRSYDLYQPFPEELNRVLASRMASWHFAPTLQEKKNLVKENIAADSIFITGNTVIDTLKIMAAKTTIDYQNKYPGKKIIIVTAHRRENFGEPLKNICESLLKLVRQFKDIVIIYPVHPNPNVNQTVYSLLSNQERVELLSPLNYSEFVNWLKAAYFILTDSGGIQEEAPALAKPVLVLRNTTERPEIIKLGLGKLVGTDCNEIVKTASLLLKDPVFYQSMAKGISPYGDGHAAEKIVKTIQQSFLPDQA